MRSIFLTLVFSSIGLTILCAQNYKSAVGARLGYPTAISYKHFLGENLATEVYIGSRGYAYSVRWVSLSAALLRHKALENEYVNNLDYYFGAGASVFAWRYGSYYRQFGRDRTYNTTSFGVQAYLGLEYTFDELPLSVSMDWAPSLFLGNGYFNGLGAAYGNLGLRYILR